MKQVGVFVDTCTVNRILDMIEVKTHATVYEEDRLYLTKLVEQYVKDGIIYFIVNPSVKKEIERTINAQRRKDLLTTFNQLHFTFYNKTIFPIVFPATFLTQEEKEILEQLYRDLPQEFKKDEKIFADVIFNQQIEILLTTDREHLANHRFRNRLESTDLHRKIKIFTPKELFDYLYDIT